MQSVLSCAAAEIEQSVPGPEQRIQAPPHSLSLQATDCRVSPQLVISQRKRVKDTGSHR
jgi:hypothetical protein